MRRVSKGWTITILVLTFLSMVFITPTFLGDSLPGWWEKVFPKKGLKLGLDLKGGMYLLMAVNADTAVEHELASIRDTLATDLNEEGGILLKGSAVKGNSLTLSFFSRDDLASASEFIDNYGSVASIEKKEQSAHFSLTEQNIKDVQSRTIDQIMQIIRNRIDEFGVLEPSIQKQGSDRVLIQVPTAREDDRARILNIIKRAAVLEFKIVYEVQGVSAVAPDIPTALAYAEVAIVDPEDPAQLEAARAELANKGLALHPGGDDTRQSERWFITTLAPGVTGEYLSSSRISFDSFGRPAVGFNFRGEGARRMLELSGENLQRRMAVVLDGKVESAPTIQERIGASGQITGNFTIEEAKDLSLVLRSGALPVPVDVEQERTIGPSLGRDSIEKGRMSMIVGGILVIIFMVLFYRLQGVVANAALLLNMVFIMGFLSAFGVTLTLPGIAGLVLTLGMAVDGNIIIFERIKEELRVGKTALAAIAAGYERSLWTVLDANITTLLTALILFWFGTGPIKGFAVTLSIGIVSTVFSNVVVARVISDYLYSGKQSREMSI